MNTSEKMSWLLRGSLLVLVVASSLGLSGCTVHSNGMTLPNPYYMGNRVQYFPKGTEFPFSNEAAHMQETQQNANY